MMNKLFAKWRRGAFALVAVFLAAATFGLSGAHSATQAQPARAAAVDYFLKIDGIEGESQDAQHKGEIEIDSYSWGLAQQGTGGSAGGGAGAGKVQFQDLHFSSSLSKASPQLMTATASGKHFKEAVLTARKAGKEQLEFYKITLSDVLISSYQTSGKDDSLPVDQVSINFAKVEVEYKQQKPDGSLGDVTKGGWDIKENKPL